ncbi:hypothetical protein RCL1_003276 [Eukaryota sp. TZLM3-RCL]
MKALAVVLLLCVVAFADEFADRELFSQFLREHPRMYGSRDELETRFAVFQGNLRRIETLREENPHAQFEVNEFADISLQEFSEKMTSIRPDEVPVTNAYKPLAHVQGYSAPNEWNWVAQGKIQAVKNQKSCAAVAVQAGGPVYDLSEQEYVDCDTRSSGCNGGWYFNAWQYQVENNRALAQSAYYPYQAYQGTCRAYQVQGAAPIADYGFPAGSLDRPATDIELKNSIYAYGSVAIALDASALQFYSRGVISNPASCNGQVNHGTNLVGYGYDNYAGYYYLMRNSWGASWGENGYARIAMNQSPSLPDGVCRINKYPAAACYFTGCRLN